MSSRTAGVAVAVKREHGRIAERCDDAAERQVRGAEIVPPLADAVRFVDHEQRNLIVCRIAMNASSSSFSGVTKTILIAPEAMRSTRARFLIFGERRVERDDVGDAELAQHVELILHQRDQRADDDGRAPSNSAGS